ncbi:MAG: hypothetical protein JSW71_13270 [Gemmatimonadota bacterium]|nr:MAG: hypothetical protein JSW71_13270 [Gemmatimonadota bacterium]
MSIGRKLPLAALLGLLAAAVLGCGPYGASSVYVGVAVPGPYVGYPYPYRGPYGGWVGRPYPSPYLRYDGSPSDKPAARGVDPAPSDTAAVADTGLTYWGW